MKICRYQMTDTEKMQSPPRSTNTTYENFKMFLLQTLTVNKLLWNHYAHMIIIFDRYIYFLVFLFFIFFKLIVSTNLCFYNGYKNYLVNNIILY